MSQLEGSGDLASFADEAKSKALIANIPAILGTLDVEQWSAFCAEIVDQFGSFSTSGSTGVTVSLPVEMPASSIYVSFYSNQPLTPDECRKAIAECFLAAAGNLTGEVQVTILAPRGAGRALAGLIERNGSMTLLLHDHGCAGSADCGCSDRTYRVLVPSPKELAVLHSTTAYHRVRFNLDLDRPDPGPVPAAVSGVEQYAYSLLSVYRARANNGSLTFSNLGSNEHVNHFQRQREYFFAAEQLKEVAREQVPPGAFKALQDEVYEGIVELADKTGVDDWSRMSDILDRAGELTMYRRNPLLAITFRPDKRGMCHQLVNDERFRWDT